MCRFMAASLEADLPRARNENPMADAKHMPRRRSKDACGARSAADFLRGPSCARIGFREVVQCRLCVERRQTPHAIFRSMNSGFMTYRFERANFFRSFAGGFSVKPARYPINGDDKVHLSPLASYPSAEPAWAVSFIAEEMNYCLRAGRPQWVCRERSPKPFLLLGVVPWIVSRRLALNQRAYRGAAFATQIGQLHEF